MKSRIAQIAQKTELMQRILAENDKLNFKIHLAAEMQRQVADNLALMLSRIYEQIEVKVQQYTTLEDTVGSLEEQIHTAVTDQARVKFQFLETRAQIVSFKIMELRSQCENLQNQLDCADRQTLGSEKVLGAIETHAQATHLERSKLQNELQRRQQTTNEVEQMCNQLQARLAARNQELSRLHASPSPRRSTTELAGLKFAPKNVRAPGIQTTTC